MFERPKTSEIPDRPGAYMFRDKHGRVIYVGKAKSLRSRVSSYFGVGLHPRTQAMLVGNESSPFLAPAGGGERSWVQILRLR